MMGRCAEIHVADVEGGYLKILKDSSVHERALKMSVLLNAQRPEGLSQSQAKALHKLICIRLGSYLDRNVWPHPQFGKSSPGS